VHLNERAISGTSIAASHGVLRPPTCRTLAVSILVLLGSPLAAAQEPAATQEPGAVTSPRKARQQRATLQAGYPSFRLGPLRLDLHGRLQTDVSRSDGRIGNASDVDLLKRRVGIEGELWRTLSFELDAQPGKRRPWRDAFIDYRVNTALRIQAGRFKVPFSLEATTSAANLDFLYRSQVAAQLAPGRERGVMFHGRLWRRRLNYEAAAFIGHADARKPDELTAVVGSTTAARVTSAPFFHSGSAMASLRAGVAFTLSGLEEGISGVHGRTTLGEPLFGSSYWARGTRRRLGAEVRWEPERFSLAAEYVRMSDARQGQGVVGDDLPPLVARGWYASGTWLLTGEPKASRIRPRRPVLRGGIGAIEVAGRVETLRFGDARPGAPVEQSPRAGDVPGSRDNILTAGINWYPHRSVKVQANLIRETLDGAAWAPTGRATVFSQVFRLQFTL
jgi:phosphate-selective porin OprO/OprP